MQAILIKDGRKSVIELPEEFSAQTNKIEEAVGGLFEGMVLFSPDDSLPDEDQALCLYSNMLGGRREDLIANFRVGQRGHVVVYGAAVIVGLHKDMCRSMTDLEIASIYLLAGDGRNLPTLLMDSHDLANP